MNHDETTKLLTLIAGNWRYQPTDDLTIRMWQAIMADADIRDVWAAAMHAIRTTQDQKRIPTAGELLQLSHGERQSRILVQNRGLKRLGTQERTLTKEQEAKGRAVLRETVEKLSERIKMPRRTPWAP